MKRRGGRGFAFWRYFTVIVVFCCLFVIGNSSMGTSQSENKRCLYEGSYKFIHSKRLAKDSRCKFSNGTRISHDSGYTILEADEDGFSFAGGEDARWHVQASCENPATPKVTVRLENTACRQEFISSADSSFEVGPEGEISIKPYQISWTCGQESWSCEMTESWELVPELW